MLTGTVSRQIPLSLSGIIGAAVIAGGLLGSAAQGQEPALATVATPFTRQVSVNWVTWDADGDGALSMKEIDALVTDPRIAGEPAAAVAALKTGLRPQPGRPGMPFGPPPSLDRSYFASYARYRVARARASLKAGTSTTPPADSPETFPDFDRLYLNNVNRLRTDSEDAKGMFGPGDPRLDRIRQGDSGDCHFLAVLGGMVVRDPDKVRRMATVLSDRSCEIAFPSGRVVHVPPLTDTQRLLLGSSGGAGTRWLALLEDAYGRARNEDRPEEARRTVSSDLVVSGGTPQRAVALVTGHASDVVWFRRGPGGPPLPQEIDRAKQPGTPLPAALAAAFRERRLVFAATGYGEFPPGMTLNHAYAVIGYDAARGMVRVWNPHSNDFTPSGETGIANGYPTAGGVFEVPLADIPRVFTMIGWELARSADTAPPGDVPGRPFRG